MQNICGFQNYTEMGTPENLKYKSTLKLKLKTTIETLVITEDTQLKQIICQPHTLAISKTELSRPTLSTAPTSRPVIWAKIHPRYHLRSAIIVHPSLTLISPSSSPALPFIFPVITSSSFPHHHHLRPCSIFSFRSPNIFRRPLS